MDLSLSRSRRQIRAYTSQGHILSDYEGGPMKTIDLSAQPDCKNPESYGEICSGCNKCGRFDEVVDEIIKAIYEKKGAKDDEDRA